MARKSKVDRMLSIYMKLREGHVLDKCNMALEYNVDERTIQRDIDDLRCFISDYYVAVLGEYYEIEYDRSKLGYVLRKAV